MDDTSFTHTELSLLGALQTFVLDNGSIDDVMDCPELIESANIAIIKRIVREEVRSFYPSQSANTAIL